MGDLITTTDRSTWLTSRYRQVRDLTETLAAPLSPEDQTVQSMPDVSPTKWHRAHTSWFFETFLLESELGGYRPFHPAYAYLFNSYYEGVGARYPRPRRGVVSRPGVAEVAEYRRHVDESMARLLQGSLAPDVSSLVELGLHHEQQHQELLLMDIKHVLSCNPLQPAYTTVKVDAPRSSPSTAWIEHDGGLAEVGFGDDDGFAFDNELPRHTTHLEPFALADRPVTCGEWLAFMDDDGYGRPDLWLSDGWATAQAEAMGGPAVLVQGGGRLVAVHPGRAPARRPGRARLPRQLLRGRRLRPVGRRPPADRGRVGGGGRRTMSRKATSSTCRSSTRGRRPRARRSSATSGSGRRAPTAPTPAFAPRPGRSASTTASSWSTSTSCGAEAASRPRITSGPPTATSSRPRRAGPSPACVLARDS